MQIDSIIKAKRPVLVQDLPTPFLEAGETATVTLVTPWGYVVKRNGRGNPKMLIDGDRLKADTEIVAPEISQ